MSDIGVPVGTVVSSKDFAENTYKSKSLEKVKRFNKNVDARFVP